MEESGLGLAEVKAIVNADAGRVRAKSKLGEGTLFAIYLPRTQENY